MKEIGFSVFDTTIARAIYHAQRPRPAVIPPLEKWLRAHGYG